MNLTQAKEALKKYFGYDSFRPMQAEIIQAIYNRKDALVLMPTGGGKSICFQIPAVTLEGTCIVVSPLISLMKDQVEALRANGIRAAFLNSSLTSQEQRQIEDDLYNKNLDLIYVSPEKMCSMEFLPLLRSIKPNLIAIDEAHCISGWGHDFRPEYAKLKFLKKEFPNVPTIALTATADKVTRKDIVKQMALRSPEVFISSFDRPNLSLEVRSGRKRIEQIVAFIKSKPNQAGIIYCLSRKNTEKVCAKLLEAGVKANFYHAGLGSTERANVQEKFIKDESQVICATVAFGMGIDKSNVRWIIHYNLPKNIEGYYQEIGRAGRDGAKAETILFYSFGDVIILKDILSSNDGEMKKIKLAKLERMYQYATAPTCRRKILLNYFNEDVRQNCGNCDVCKNPPEFIEGTVIAQKALSAVARLREGVAMGMLIDVLRGSQRSEIFRFGYNRIKTYGAGSDIGRNDWQNFLEQMLNQGLIEVAYDDHNKVKLTLAAKAVLFEGEKVQLVRPETIKKREQAEKAKSDARGKKPAKMRVRDKLFEYIRLTRLDLARAKGVPPYIVFSDATLEEMAATKPRNRQEMSQISGVGEVKLNDYGQVFLDSIREFLLKMEKERKPEIGASHLETYQLFKEGLTLQQVAQKKNIQPKTVFSHLIALYESGKDVPVRNFVSEEEIQRISEIIQPMDRPYRSKDVFVGLNEELSYEKIRMALIYLRKEEDKMRV